MLNKLNIKPCVKWVGGKKKVIDKYLDRYLPKEFNDFYEPFVGGGAMSFHLQNQKTFINDINNELITTYKIIQKKPNELIKLLDEYTSKHSEKFYYKLRSELPKTDLEIAARFIYLNKTCFNGIYRVNSSGIFNVPYNGVTKDKLRLYDYENIMNMSNFFQKSVSFKNEDYLSFLEHPTKGDFVFIDSPYDYEEGVKGFDSYNKNSFGQKNQILLAEMIKKLDKKGVKFMATNHSTKLIKELYKSFNLIEITTDRFINSDASNRKNGAVEVIITNYKDFKYE